MTAEGCETLTDRERDCLRMVGNNLQSKHIARELGISVRTVNGYCDSARAKLGVADRFEAARVFRAYEQDPYRLTGEPIRVAPDPSSFQTDAATPASAATAGTVGEARTPFVHDALPIAPFTTLPLSSERRPQNDLTSRQRLAAIGWIAGRMVFYIALFVLAVEAFSRVVFKLFHH